MVIVELNQSNWEEEASRSNILTLVYFWHHQCPWCRQLAPILERVVEEYLGKIKFARLDILGSPSNQEMAINPWVMSTSTLIFFCARATLKNVAAKFTDIDL